LPAKEICPSYIYIWQKIRNAFSAFKSLSQDYDQVVHPSWTSLKTEEIWAGEIGGLI
jgi:hypothetical protein